MSDLTGKKLIPVYVTEPVYREIKVYAAQTDKTIQDVCKLPSQAFEQEAIKLVAQIKEMRRQADLEAERQAEITRIVEENPLKVTGHEVDPIGQELEQPIQA